VDEPDGRPATSAEIAGLAPNLEIQKDWRGPTHLAESIRRVTEFLARHTPTSSGCAAHAALHVHHLLEWRSMRRLILLPLFLALSLDFATPDALLVVPGGRSLQWDDEEESVPSRRQRVRPERHDTAPPGARPSVVLTRPQRVVESVVPADRRNRPTAWLVPIRQARLSSLSSAAPPEDH
jgi:hypothetical protein